MSGILFFIFASCHPLRPNKLLCLFQIALGIQMYIIESINYLDSTYQGKYSATNIGQITIHQFIFDTCKDLGVIVV